MASNEQQLPFTLVHCEHNLLLLHDGTAIFRARVAAEEMVDNLFIQEPHPRNPRVSLRRVFKKTVFLWAGKNVMHVFVEEQPPTEHDCGFTDKPEEI